MFLALLSPGMQNYIVLYFSSLVKRKEGIFALNLKALFLF